MLPPGHRGTSVPARSRLNLANAALLPEVSNFQLFLACEDEVKLPSYVFRRFRKGREP